MKNRLVFISAIGIFFIIAIISFITGSVDINLLHLDKVTSRIFFGIRFPRILLGMIAGMVLATSGGVLQGMLNNPLAEPYLLGISSGAALGSIIAVILQKVYLMPVFGFLGALLTIFLVWELAKNQKVVRRTKLILAGIIINLFFSAVIALIMSIFQKDLGHIFSILMGNLSFIFSQNNIWLLWAVGIISLIGVIVLNIYSSKLNILTLGDYTAESLGVDVQRTRKSIFIISSLLVGIIVSFTGIIGFVGLIIPHICRMLLGPDHKYLLPLSGIMGASFLILSDTIARSCFVIELPVGVVTSLCGAPFFVYLLKKN